METNHSYLKVKSQQGSIVWLEIINHEYAGLVFHYDKVEFEETGDPETPFKIIFEYQIIDTPFELIDKIDYDLLEKCLFTWLCDLIEQQLQENEVIYSGGTFENREHNTQ